MDSATLSLRSKVGLLLSRTSIQQAHVLKRHSAGPATILESFLRVVVRHSTLLGVIFVWPWKDSSTIFPPWRHPINLTHPFISTPPPTSILSPPSLALSFSLSLFPTSVVILKKTTKTQGSCGWSSNRICKWNIFIQSKKNHFIEAFWMPRSSIYSSFSKAKVRKCGFRIFFLFMNMCWLTLTAFDRSDRCWFTERSITQYRTPDSTVSAQRGAEAPQVWLLWCRDTENQRVFVPDLLVFMDYSESDRASCLGRSNGLLRTPALQEMSKF